MPDSTDSKIEGVGVIAQPDADVAGAEPTANDSSTEPETLWRAIRESLRGSHPRHTLGPIGRSIIMLAIPMVLRC